MGGINWATHRAEADVTPNISKVTPNASTLPKFKEAEKKAASKKDAEKKAN